ncbi:MAG TPA: PAS domain S-box protein [Candidatus Acidoferrales bacterium]|nr:PAS domain S-box protein [Candidatus Acidoferrales bacterium]
MRPINFRLQVTLAFGGAVLLFALIGVLSYRRILQEDADQGWVEHTHLVLERIDAVEFDLTNTESDGHSSPLGAPPLQKDMSELRRLTSDNPKQQQALDQLKTIIDSGALGPALGVEQHSSETSKARTQATVLFQGMRKEEQALLGHRLESAKLSSRSMRAVLSAGGSLTVILVLVAGFVVERENRKTSQTEAELRGAEERYHLLFDSNPLPAWVYDVQSLAILDVNAEAITHYGYSREEFLKAKITDIRPAEDVAAFLKSVAMPVHGPESSGPWRHEKKSGEIIEVEIKSYPLVFDGKQTRLVVALDVTARNKFEAALRLSEERFRLMVSGVKDYAILMLDPSGRVVSWNEGAQRIKGYQADEIIGQHFSRFYTDEDIQRGKPARELEIVAREGRLEDEGWRVRKDGSRFWANVVITALRDEAGELRGFGKVTRDMTERKKTEEALKASEEEMRLRNAQLDAANKELEAFSYSVSHDLRSPLRSIDGFSEALLEDCAGKLDEAQKNHLDRIRAGTKRMGLLIDDLLNLARVARADMRREKINLSEVARSIIADLQKAQPQRQVEFRIEEGLETTGDSRLIRLACENLLGNAWKFTSKCQSAQIEVGRTDNNGSSAYFVRDNGAGFNQAYAGKLFGAFQRLHGMTEFPGTGVGLATVQRIIHRHGGRIWAEGALEKGATFYFTL